MIYEDIMAYEKFALDFNEKSTQNCKPLFKPVELSWEELAIHVRRYASCRNSYRNYLARKGEIIQKARRASLRNRIAKLEMRLLKKNPQPK